MRVYTVHIDPVSPRPDRDAVLVREGFSWPAALFTVLWALYHRLWLAAAALLAAAVALDAALAALGADALAALIVELAFVILIGMWGGELRRAGLARRGYVLVDVAAGRDLGEAELRFFDRFLARP